MDLKRLIDNYLDVMRSMHGQVGNCVQADMAHSIPSYTTRRPWLSATVMVASIPAVNLR